MKKLTAVLIGSMITCTANAATWYGFLDVFTDNSYYFFDRDTIVKRQGEVTIWIKSVRDLSRLDSEGISSIASKYSFYCEKRSYKVLTTVVYGADSKHLQTDSRPLDKSEVVPGTISEGLLETICEPAFPNPKSEKHVKIRDNDIYSLSKRLFDGRADPAPK